jgi:hypothetical protein
MCTNRAGVQLSCNWNRRDTIGMLVHLGHMTEVDMAKALCHKIRSWSLVRLQRMYSSPRSM